MNSARAAPEWLGNQRQPANISRSFARSLARSLTLLDCPPPPLPGMVLFFLLLLPLPLALPVALLVRQKS